MAFKVLFMAHAPDADKEKHRSMIDTGKYQLHTVVVKNQTEALETCRSFIEKEKIDSILLCPGFTHSDVAEIVKTAGDRVGVAVARGDGVSNRLFTEFMKREKYFQRD